MFRFSLLESCRRSDIDAHLISSLLRWEIQYCSTAQ